MTCHHPLHLYHPCHMDGRDEVDDAKVMYDADVMDDDMDCLGVLDDFRMGMKVLAAISG